MPMVLADTHVVSLRDDVQRRHHIVEHFAAIGLERYRFWPAVRHDDPRVAVAFRDGTVKRWPPCFRCGKPACDCRNNVLIPPQVANWLSFVTLWRSLPDDPAAFHLICEDDVHFRHGALDRLEAFLSSYTPRSPRVLIRLAQSGEDPGPVVDQALERTQRVAMSNAAYIVNGAMAAFLARAFCRIEHTSDVWLHAVVAADPTIDAFTLEPLVATDLSYNRDFARFKSRIHPKGIDESDRARQATHRMRATSDAEYAELLASWGVLP